MLPNWRDHLEQKKLAFGSASNSMAFEHTCGTFFSAPVTTLQVGGTSGKDYVTESRSNKSRIHQEYSTSYFLSSCSWARQCFHPDSFPPGYAVRFLVSGSLRTNSPT